MSDPTILDGSRFRNNRSAATPGEHRYTEVLPVSMRTSPRAGVRLLDAIDAGERTVIITAQAGTLNIRAQLERSNGTEIEYGSLSVDWSRGTVASRFGRVTLSRTELRLLAVLVERQGAIVDHEQLLENTWPVPSEESGGLPLLHVYVDSLRHRLAAIGGASCLRSVRRAGYLFTP